MQWLERGWTTREYLPMTPMQKIKRDILMMAGKEPDLAHIVANGITAETVDEQYGMLMGANSHWDYETEFREGQVETGLPCEYSRNYESKAVARKLSDGTWVGWTYWYGGGKHGEPEAVPWMRDAYDLAVTEVEKVVVVREFKKVDAPKA